MKSQVRINAERDPSYAPFRLPCPGLVRMALVEPFYWRCSRGHEHDERATPSIEGPKPEAGPGDLQPLTPPAE